MIFKAISVLVLFLLGLTHAGSHRFIQAPIRISDFSGLRAYPLSQSLRFHSPQTFPRAQVLQRAPLPQIIALRPKFVEEETKLDPTYNFGYSVSDSLTGDTKTREESRDGDVVRGSYSVADPDGRIRTVTYTADAENGFQAKVTYDGKEGPVSIPTKPKEKPTSLPAPQSSGSSSLFTQIRDEFQEDDSDAIIIEGRQTRDPSKVRSESLSVLYPVSIPERGFQGLTLGASSSYSPRTSHFITPDGRIITASLN